MLEKRIIELLTRKMAGELSAEELLELNELLATYPEAIQEKELLETIWNSKVIDESVGDFYERHKKRFDDALSFERDTSAIKKFWNAGWVRYAIAACVTGALCMSTYLIWRKMNDHDSFKHIIAGKGVRKLVVLPDGTKVWLNADSKLSYDETMNKSNIRSVQLAGEAYFDVAHNKEHPFVITTNKVSIRVLGTAFNVKAYPNEKKCETTLIRGSVELTVNDDSKQKIVLKPSEKLALIEEGEGKVINKAATSQQGKTVLIEHVNAIKEEDKEYIAETSWTENMLVLQNETFEEIKTKLERWYNVKVEIGNDKIKSQHFTGTFANETIEQVLNAMKLIQNFNYKINNNDVTIY